MLTSHIEFWLETTALSANFYSVFSNQNSNQVLNSEPPDELVCTCWINHFIEEVLKTTKPLYQLESLNVIDWHGYMYTWNYAKSSLPITLLQVTHIWIFLSINSWFRKSISRQMNYILIKIYNKSFTQFLCLSR